MKLPPNDSPAWPLMRIVVVSTMSIIGVSVGYTEGWVTRSDLPVILYSIIPLCGIDGVQFFRKKKE